VVAISTRVAAEPVGLEHWQATLEVLTILEDFAATLGPAGDIRACPNPVVINLIAETRAQLFAQR